MATKMLRLESSLLYNSVYLMKVSNKRFVTPRYQNSSAFPPILNDTKIKEVKGIMKCQFANSLKVLETLVVHSQNSSVIIASQAEIMRGISITFFQ